MWVASRVERTKREVSEGRLLICLRMQLCNQQYMYVTVLLWRSLSWQVFFFEQKAQRRLEQSQGRTALTVNITTSGLGGYQPQIHHLCIIYCQQFRIHYIASIMVVKVERGTSLCFIPVHSFSWFVRIWFAAGWTSSQCSWNTTPAPWKHLNQGTTPPGPVSWKPHCSTLLWCVIVHCHFQWYDYTYAYVFS